MTTSYGQQNYRRWCCYLPFVIYSKISTWSKLVLNIISKSIGWNLAADFRKIQKPAILQRKSPLFRIFLKLKHTSFNRPNVSVNHCELFPKCNRSHCIPSSKTLSRLSKPENKNYKSQVPYSYSIRVFLSRNPSESLPNHFPIYVSTSPYSLSPQPLGHLDNGFWQY